MPLFFTLPHINTPMAMYSMLVMPLFHIEGGRMRWPFLFLAPMFHVAWGASASFDCQLDDPYNSARLGMLTAALFTGVSQTGLWPTQRLVPARVSAGVGMFYFTYHAYVYYLVTHKLQLEDDVDDEL